MSIVQVKKVSKKYGKSYVLEKIELDVTKGEIVGLIGPSGAGKTTLVKTIIGMEKPDEGSVTVFDTLIPNRKILNKIGYMAQSDALYEELTGKENLIFFAKLFVINKNELIKRINYVAGLVNLNDHLSKKVCNYSGGMKRRLSLAISLVQNPDLLILDEPTVGIDPELRASIWIELKQLKNKGKSIIITTHVMDEAEKCDRLVLIRDGKAITTGTPFELKELFNVNIIEEVFLKIGRDE